MRPRKSKLPNGNTMIVFNKTIEDLANKGLEPSKIVISEYDPITDVGVIVTTQEIPDSFADVVEPVMKWLCENKQPHSFITIGHNSSELWEGIETHVTDQYLKD